MSTLIGSESEISTALRETAMTTSKHVVPGNRLLAALPERNRRNFFADCERVKLDFSKVICDSGDVIRHVYFPLEGFISLVTTLNDGARLEVGMVGDEGMLGMPLVLGVNISSQHALVQGAGTALRMSAATFVRYCKRNPTLRNTLKRYAYVLMRQLAQMAACTHYHVVEERLARWLLLTRDCAHSNRFYLTHEFLAYMLGVRRVGITEAATSLHKLGLINYSRGEILILDEAGLEKVSCGCYRQGKEIYEQTLSPQRGASHRH
jgi:CRP-like cAMP-binding protein